MSRLLICAPDIFQGDAVGNHCLSIANIAKKNNIEAILFAQRFSRGVRNINEIWKSIKNDDVIFLSYSIFDPFLDSFIKLPNKKICYFHGVTPYKLLKKFDYLTSELCRKSSIQFPLLCNFDYLLANSKISSDDLKRYLPLPKKIIIIPPLTESMFASLPPKKEIFFKRNKINLVVLGRVVPHKCLEDAIKIVNKLSKLKLAVNLKIVGSFDNQEYFNYLKSLINNFGLGNHISFIGFVTNKKKYQYIFNADFLISTSKHEGFGVPLMEAMYMGTPIIYRKKTISHEISMKIPTSYSNINEAANIISNYFNKKLDIYKLSRLSLIESKNILSNAKDKNYMKILRFAN
jgi:glycosyltransferase involved in cell wall biosynthesis